MADAQNPFDQFDAAAPVPSGNAFDQFDASPPPPSAPPTVSHETTPPVTSQSLGFYKGVTTPIDNAARGLKWVANNVIPGGNRITDPETGKILQPGFGDTIDWLAQKAGFASAEDAQQAHKDYIAKQEAQGEKPGAWGEVAGDILGTLPTAAIGSPAAAGALSGGLLSDTDDTLDVLKNIAIGAGAGKAADVALNAVGKPIMRAVANSAPAQRATQYVRDLLDTSGNDVQDLGDYATNTFGKPVTSAEAMGPTGIQQLTALGRRSGATSEPLAQMLAERKEGVGDRILADYAQASGIDPEAAQGQMTAFVQAGRKRADPLYQEAFNAPPVTTDYLSRLSQEPIIQQGMARGVKIERLRALADNRPFDPNAYAITDFNAVGDPIIGGVPTWKTWDAAKTGLDEMLEDYRDGTTRKINWTKMASAIDGVRRSLLGELDATNPAYKTARQAAGDYLSANEAYNAGKRAIFSSTTPAEVVAQIFSGMSPTEQEAFKGGIANQLYSMAQNARLSGNTFNRPIIRDKLSAVLGDDVASDFLNKMRVESEMAKAGARMAPGTNSVTSDVMNATAEQNHLGTAADVASLVGHASHGNPIGVASRAISLLRRAGAFGRTGTMPLAVRDETGRLLMMRPDELADYLSSPAAASDPAGVMRLRRVMTSLSPALRSGVTALAVGATQPAQ